MAATLGSFEVDKKAEAELKGTVYELVVKESKPATHKSGVSASEKEKKKNTEVEGADASIQYPWNMTQDA